MNTRKIIVELEVTDDTTNEEVHEALCTLLHEQDTEYLENLINEKGHVDIFVNVKIINPVA